MRVMVDSRWIGIHGIQRFAREVLSRVPTNIEIVLFTGGPRFSSPLGPVWLSAKMLGKKGDVFFTPGYLPPVYSKVPVVVSIHDLIHVEGVTNQAKLKLEYYQRIILPAAKRAARIVTVSEFSKQRIAAWMGTDAGRITVVGNGVDPYFCPGEKISGASGPPYFLYVGGHKPHKNLPRLVSAFSKSGLMKTHRLVLTGTPEKHVLDELHAIDPQLEIHFTGKLSDEELRTYYREALALVFPSLYEGFGLPAAEAMACGTPVVVSNTTSLPEVVGDAAVFVDPLDVESIASGMVRIAADGELRRDLSERGIQRAKIHSWDRTAGLVWDAVIQCDGRAE